MSIKSGSLCIDYGIELPTYGLVEYLGYPRCGMSTLLKELCRVNDDKRILYVHPYKNIQALGEHVAITNVGIIEAVANSLYRSAKELDIVILDSLPDFVSSEELSIVEESGFENLNTATTANIWFNVLRILRGIIIEYNLLLIIGNIRKTRIRSNVKKSFESEYPRESAQSMDKFSSLTIKFEVAKRRTTSAGVNLLVDNWVKRKEEKGLPIPINSGVVRHDIEKHLILASNGIVRKVGNNAIYIDGTELSFREHLNRLGNDYNMQSIIERLQRRVEL